MNTHEFSGSTFVQSCNGMPKDTMEFSQSSTSHSCPSSSEQAATSYFQPSHITLNHQNGSLAVDWHTAPNGYQIVLYHEHQDIASQVAINPPARFNMAGLPAGKYCAKVYVKTDNEVEQACDVCTPTIVKLDTPSDIALFYDQVAQKVKVNWKEVPGAIEYQVQLMAVLNSNESLTTDQQFEIDAAVLTKPVRSYHAWVQAKGDAQHIDSEVGQSIATLSMLPAPVAVTQKYDVETKQLTVSWERVPAATGYLVQVVNLDANQQILYQQQVDRSQTSYTFDSSQWLEGGAGAYQIRVKAIGNQQLIDSELSRATSSIPRLAAPNSIQQHTVMSGNLPTLLFANWRAVPQAIGYLAQVVEVNQNQVMQERILPPIDSNVNSQPDLTLFQFDTTAFPDNEAQYQIRVKSLGDAQHLDSAFGQATPPIKRLAAPTQVTIASTSTTLSANWRSVSGAAKYYAQVINLDRNNLVVMDQFILPQPEQPLIASFEIAQFLKGQPPANYQIWVSAIGEETDTQTLASSFGKPSNMIPLVDTTSPDQPVDSATTQAAAKKLINLTESSVAAMQMALNDSNAALQLAIAALEVADDRNSAQAAVDAVTQVIQAIQIAQAEVESTNRVAQVLPQPLTIDAAVAVAATAKTALKKAAESTFAMAAASRANFEAEKAAANSSGASAATQSREAITQSLNSLQAAVQIVKAASDAAEALVQILITKQSAQ